MGHPGPTSFSDIPCLFLFSSRNGLLRLITEKDNNLESKAKKKITMNMSQGQQANEEIDNIYQDDNIQTRDLDMIILK